MHELAVTQSMLDLALEEATKAGASRIRKISIVIGEMSGIVGDCVKFYFEFLSKNSPAEGATVLYRSVATEVKCRSCAETFQPKEFDWSCPGCHNLEIEVTKGKELYVESIEVE